MMTIFNTVQGLNDFAEETTYRLSGQIELEGPGRISLETMVASSEMPMPPAMQLAGWWGDKFNRLFLNPVEMPRLKRVEAVIDLLPERRIAAIESAWLDDSKVEAGGELRGKLFLRPYRGERIVREFTVQVPPSASAGDHVLLLSDADTLNRVQSMAGQANRYLDVRQIVSLMNQERSNDKVYISMVDSRPTVYYDDKALANLPASVLNVLQSSRGTGRPFVTSSDSARLESTLAFDQIISGSASLRFTVK
jgi:hypothetical protein